MPGRQGRNGKWGGRRARVVVPLTILALALLVWSRWPESDGVGVDATRKAPGLTREPPICAWDEECGPHERCLFGGCVDGLRDCEGDDDCGEAARCELGSCVAGRRLCAGDDECEGEQSVCRFGACVEGPV